MNNIAAFSKNIVKTLWQFIKRETGCNFNSRLIKLIKIGEKLENYSAAKTETFVKHFMFLLIIL